jgi:hypothetical protein
LTGLRGEFILERMVLDRDEDSCLVTVSARGGPLFLTAFLFFACAGCGIFSPNDLPPLDGRTEALEDVESSVCPEGEIDCEGFCVDPLTDRLNCGGCGNECDALETCQNGTCTCLEGYEKCGETCVNVMTDRRHCGECDHACDPLATCQSGVCVCPAGLTDCGGECVDTNTDSENCGSCGNACTGGEFCNGSGHCAMECDPPYTLCNPGGDAYCADLQNDPYNCSTCGNVCPGRDHAVPVCVGGVCSILCDFGYGNANGDEVDGCECTITSATELCDAVDNDCDGRADEDFECVMGASGACTLVASCEGGQLCGSSCTWGPCENTAWGCTNPGSTESRDCGDGSCGTQSRTCESDCSWGDWGTCTLKTSSQCFTGETGSCTPPGTACTGTHTCMSGCTWGTCTDTCGGTTPLCCTEGCRQCCDDGDCGDSNPCTSDTCSSSGTCSNPNRPDMTSCTGGLCCGGVCRSGAECCSDADCAGCAGTAQSCSFFNSEPVGCEIQAGCTWHDSSCQGTPYTCAMHDNIPDCYDCGCSWGGSHCLGGPRPCVDHLEEMECMLCGCTWEYYYCDGSAAPCSSLTTQSACQNQDGCHWSTCNSYHCT